MAKLTDEQRCDIAADIEAYICAVVEDRHGGDGEDILAILEMLADQDGA